jgi:hypothetical protein
MTTVELDILVLDLTTVELALVLPFCSISVLLLTTSTVEFSGLWFVVSVFELALLVLATQTIWLAVPDQ